jgi:hypothetical protein
MLHITGCPACLYTRTTSAPAEHHASSITQVPPATTGRKAAVTAAAAAAAASMALLSLTSSGEHCGGVGTDGLGSRATLHSQHHRAATARLGAIRCGGQSRRHQTVTRAPPPQAGGAEPGGGGPDTGAETAYRLTASSGPRSSIGCRAPLDRTTWRPRVRRRSCCAFEMRCRRAAASVAYENSSVSRGQCKRSVSSRPSPALLAASERAAVKGARGSGLVAPRKAGA